MVLSEILATQQPSHVKVAPLRPLTTESEPRMVVTDKIKIRLIAQDQSSAHSSRNTRAGKGFNVERSPAIDHLILSIPRITPISSHLILNGMNEKGVGAEKGFHPQLRTGYKAS